MVPDPMATEQTWPSEQELREAEEGEVGEGGWGDWEGRREGAGERDGCNGGEGGILTEGTEGERK